MQRFNTGIWDRVDSPKLPQGDSFLNYIHRDGYGLYRYIPFYKRYEYTTGITFHFHKAFITGVEAYYGENTELTGVYSGVALHLPLEYNERIYFVWIKLVRDRSPRYPTPAFIVSSIKTASPLVLDSLHRFRFKPHMEGHVIWDSIHLLTITNSTSGIV